jgi:predicted permease
MEAWRKLRFLLSRRRLTDELDEEMRFHLEMLAQQTGDLPSARRQFGNFETLKEASRDMWSWTQVEQLVQDLRYALRQLAARPGFTAVAALSLALGIGANVAIFSLIDHVMLRLLPVRNPGELMVVRRPFSYPRFEDLRKRNTVFSSMVGVHLVPEMEVKDLGRATGELVSGNYFATLGVGAVRGRTLLPEDDAAPESGPVAVISYGYWKRAFGGAPDVLGRKLQVRSGKANANTGGLDVFDGPGSRSMNGAVLSIVGVAPPEFFGDTVGTSTDIWIPMMMQPAVMPGRPFLRQPRANWVNIMGRLKPDVNIAQATSALLLTWRQILTAAEGSELTEKRRREIAESIFRTESGEKGFGQIRRQFSEPLLVLMTVVGLVLLIACLNVANLLLARATTRKREIGVRLALGAGRLRLVRQLLTESLLLAGIGGVLGIAIAYLGTSMLLSMLSGVGLPVTVPFETDLRTLAFLAAVSMATGILFGLAPALRATRVSLADTLKDAGRTGSARGGAAKVLVAAQVAVSMLLLIGAGLFLRTLYNLKAQDVGFNPERLLIVNVDPVSAGYRGDDVGRAMKTLLDRLRTVPGVRAATFSENGLFSGTESGTLIEVEGFQPGSDKDSENRFDQVGPDYFRNVGIPILLGRDMNERDVPGALRVAIINDAMANFYFHDASPLGKHLTFRGIRMEIVGVVRDVRDHDLRDQPLRRFYVSYFQPIDGITTANFELRTVGNPGAVAFAVRKEVEAVNRSLSVLSIKDVRELMDGNVVAERLVAILSTFFGALAMILAAIGLYGVISYAVARKTAEIGIRIALGAGRSRVIGMILGEVAVLIAIGGIAGIGAAFLATRLIRSFLYGLTALDPVAFGGAALVLALVGVAAGYLPARRAAAVDPMVALRYE